MPPACHLPLAGEDFRFWGRRHRKREAGACMPAWPARTAPDIDLPPQVRYPSAGWGLLRLLSHPLTGRSQPALGWRPTPFLPRQGEVAPRSGDGGGGKRNISWCFLPLGHASGMPPPPGGGGIGVVCKLPSALICAMLLLPHPRAHSPSASSAPLREIRSSFAASREPSPPPPPDDHTPTFPKVTQTRRAERFPRHAGLTRPAGCGTAVAILGGPPPPACLGRTLKS